MNWIGRVLLLAGGLASSMTLLGFAFGFGWASLIAGPPAFLAVIILVPFLLVVRDRRVAAKRRLRDGKKRRTPRRRMSRPPPMVLREVALRPGPAK